MIKNLIKLEKKKIRFTFINKTEMLPKLKFHVNWDVTNVLQSMRPPRFIVKDSYGKLLACTGSITKSDLACRPLVSHWFLLGWQSYVHNHSFLTAVVDHLHNVILPGVILGHFNGLDGKLLACTIHL